MKIILSRKGFDAASGGCPSPILPDGSMLALPIPDAVSPVRYRELAWNGRSIGALLPRLAGARAGLDDGAHLDPDLRAERLERPANWRPIFGQHGAAWGHLRNQGVAPRDIFLFFGLFREIANDGTFVPRAPARHLLWGWMQIEEILPVDRHRARLYWARYHPHLARAEDPTNVVFLGTRRLQIPGFAGGRLPGAGVFPRCLPVLQLTASGAAGPSTWRLPSWFHPANRRSSLSYHADPSRWTRDGGGVLLRVVGRGQEFVIDGNDYPEALPWVASLVEQGAGAGGSRMHPAEAG